jgi:cytidylate kinase
MPNSLIIAIDGPSGAGKSSVSRAVATELGLDYLDTGSMYRAMTWFMQNSGVDISNPQLVAQMARAEVIQPSIDPSEPGIRVVGRDVSIEIRSAEVTQGVSAVSAVPEVRELMVNLQREIAANSSTGIVVDFLSPLIQKREQIVVQEKTALKLHRPRMTWRSGI